MPSPLRPIFVTGSHRSGSTWVGRMLAAAPETAYVHEPFNINVDISVASKSFQYWYRYVCEENAAEYGAVLDDVIRYAYPLGLNTAKASTFRHAGKIIKDQARFLFHRVIGSRPLIKDPFAVFSLEWLYRRYNADILVLIRHPAAFVSSLKIKNWRFDFRHFQAQPYLMDSYLAPFEGEIRRHVHMDCDIVEQAILLWNCIYHTVGAYREKHLEWQFVRHEDLSVNPVAGFQAIYDAFDLTFTPRVQQKILKSSGAHNPSERGAGDEFLRNSRENLHNWKSRLEPGEIELIKAKTYDVSRRFYSEDEW